MRSIGDMLATQGKLPSERQEEVLAMTDNQDIEFLNHVFSQVYAQEPGQAFLGAKY